MDSNRKLNLPVYGILLVAAVLTRFPFFFHDVINWDESTFILVGQSIVDGHLPYVTLYELKPPLLFYFFAAVIWIGGKSIFAIRLAGALCVWVSACFTYSIGRRLGDARMGFVAAALFIVASAVIAGERGQATMSETITLVPLMASLVVLKRNPSSAPSLFLAGVLIAGAALVRSNLVFVAFAVGLWVLVINRQRPFTQVVGKVLAYCAGGILVVFLAFIPYLLAHQARTFWDAVFIAPIIYSSTQSGPWATLAIQVTNALGISLGSSFPNTDNLIGLGVWVAGAVGLGILLMSGRHTVGAERREQWLLLSYALGTALSIVFGGATYSHYLIQLLPFSCLYAAVAYSRVANWPMRRGYGLAFAATVLALALLPVARQYSVIITRMRAGETLAYGTSYGIAKILGPSCRSGCSLYSLTDQLAYWFLNATPPTRLAVHPADVIMNYSIKAADGPEETPESEVRKILHTKPDFIIKPDVVWYLTDPAALNALKTALKSDYRLRATTEDQRIYQRVAS